MLRLPGALVLPICYRWQQNRAYLGRFDERSNQPAIPRTTASMRLSSQVLLWAILDSNQGPLPYQRRPVWPISGPQWRMDTEDSELAGPTGHNSQSRVLRPISGDLAGLPFARGSSHGLEPKRRAVSRSGSGGD